MNLFQLSNKTKASLSEIEARIKSHQEKEAAFTLTDEHISYWQFFQDAEEIFFN